MADAAAIYVRISRDAMALGLGVARQRETCRQVADARGWAVTRIYEDNDLSAYDGGRRPAYTQMCQAIRAGLHDAIICVDQDRLTRHPRELEDVIDLAVPIALSSGELDLTTSDDRLRARMLGAVARQESERKSERIRRQKDDARRRGWWLGRPPYGYRTVDSGDGGRKLEPVPDEVAVIRQLAVRTLAGATMLSSAQWASRETGRSWAPVTVRRVLTRPASGGWQPDGQGSVYRHPGTGLPVPVVDGEPALDEVTWRRLRDHFAGRRRTGVDGRSSQVYLARLVHCQACGHRMSWSAARSYVCRTSSERSGGCPGNAAAGRRVDELVDTVVAARLEQLTGTTDVRPSSATAEVARLSALLDGQEAERRRLLLDGATPERVSAQQATVDAIDRQLRDARAVVERDRRRVDLSGLAGLTGPGAADRFLASDVEVRRATVRLVVRRVTVRPAGGRTSKFDPSRVTVDLAV